MSASVSHDKCEPNLTPMLDMVLQLVMFFMLCANFLMEELSQAVKLPDAVSARPLDKNVNKMIYINMTVAEKDTKAALTLSQGPVKEVFSPSQMLQLKKYLQNQFETDKKKTSEKDWNDGKGRTTIILRADYRLTFKEVNETLKTCREAGYSNINLRAIQKGTEK